MSNITDEIIAKNKVERFVSRFEDSYYLLACHVALPLVLTPRLVNYLRMEFLRSAGVPWIAEADLLLSNLCRQVGYELYVMDQGVRAYLLKKLEQDPRFGKKRIKEIARLLLSYVKYLYKTNSFLGEKDLQVQRWGALLYLDTEQTVKEVAIAISKCLEKSELSRLLKVTEDFKQQIVLSGQFQDFLDYAQICNELLRETEKVKPEKIADSYQIAEVELFIPRVVLSEELEKGRLFHFEVVKVNDIGKVTNRSQRSARQKIEDLGNGIKLEMVYIPGGTFLMGSPDTEAKRYDDEGPQHKVTLKPFYMSKYSITQEQYQAIMGDNPSHFKGKNRPVESVSWYDATNFCQKLSKKIGGKYSLPSESQWEYACRAGTTTPFYFGDTITTDLANYRGTDYKEWSGCYGKGPKGEYREETTPVGEFPPNAFGLYDMHGNVWEWCADDFHKNYNGAPTDGSVWLNGDKEKSPLRGGSWYNNPNNCRSAIRDDYIRRDDLINYIGFRLVCDGGRPL